MNTSKFSFLHRRPFWAIVLGLVGLFALFLFYQFVSDLNSFDSRVLFYANASFGGLFWFFLGSKIFGAWGGIILGVLYVCLVIYLIKQTFKGDFVQLRYPLIVILLYALGFLTSVTFFTGL